MTLAAANRNTEKADLIAINGEAAVCDPRGLLFFPEWNLLAVSDLHLEKGSSLARRGALIPPYDTAATLIRLQGAVAHYGPRIVVSLGDSFHDREASERLPGVFRDALSALMAGRTWIWVGGNHDPEPPKAIGGESAREIAIGGVRFRHEPSPDADAGEIAGHLHPCARIVQRGHSVRRRCFAADGRRVVMPAFGSYTGSLNVLDRAFAGLFRRESLMAYMLGSDRAYPILGAMLHPG